MRYFPQHMKVAGLGRTRCERCDLNEQTNQRPRRAEDPGLPNQRAAQLFALLFELSSNSRLTTSLSCYEVISCQQTEAAT